MACRKFILTGASGSGKSYTVQAVVQALAQPMAGFLTLPYMIEGQVKGHYFHSIPEVPHMENNLPINLRTGDCTCIPLPQVFATLGVACLQQALHSAVPLLVLDEIGRIEREESAYLALLHDLFDSDCCLLAVCKKEPLPHIQALCERPDVQVLDLDVLPVALAQKRMIESFRCYL